MAQKNFFFLVSLSLITLASCKSEKTSNWTTLEFHQTTPVIVDYKIKDSSSSHGDMHFFEANLMDTTDKVVGQAIGYHVMVDIPGKDGMGMEEMDERITTMIYRFNEKDAIMVQGGLIFNPGDMHIVPEKENYRAIVGGTGIYKGVKGQSIVMAHKDGKIHVKLDIKND